MHFNQLLPCLLVSATAAVAQLIPIGPIATFYDQPNYQGHFFSAGKVGQCLELPSNIIGNVSSVKLQQLPSPLFISCALYANDYCSDPAASVVWYATSLFDNTILPNTNVRSVTCKLTKLLP
ncbi:hypothetical protein ACHAQJ_006438 [Trichoderma viride]